MPKGTSELEKLLQEAAARKAEEEAQARAAEEEAARAVQVKPARARRTTKRATAAAAAASDAAGEGPAAVPAAAPVPPVPPARPEPSLPPLVDLDAIDDEYASSNSADRPPLWVAPSAPPPLPPPQPWPTGRNRRGLVAGAVIAGLTVAGGGVGLLLAGMGSGPSQASYIARADAICGSANAPVAAIGMPTSYPELDTASSTVATAAKGQVSQLSALERPSGAAGGVALAVVTALDTTAQAAQRMQVAAGARDDAGTIAGTHALGAAFNDAKAKAAAYGFTACATGMQSGIDNLYAGASGVIKTAFVAKADTLCRATAREMDGLPEPRNTSGREIARLLDRVAAISEKWTADMKALPVAPGDEATLAEIFASLDKLNAKGRELQAAAAAEDGSRILAIDREMSPLITAVDSKLDAYGLGVCGSNFGEY